MSVFDFSPAYRYHSAMQARSGQEASYPAYNIEAADDRHYRISVAVVGFTEQQLSIELDNQVLTVKGQVATDTPDPQQLAYQALHQGIVQRDFVHRYQLEEHVEVVEAKLDNGILVVNLVKRVPDAKKPKRIGINTLGDPGVCG